MTTPMKIIEIIESFKKESPWKELITELLEASTASPWFGRQDSRRLWSVKSWCLFVGAFSAEKWWAATPHVSITWSHVGPSISPCEAPEILVVFPLDHHNVTSKQEVVPLQCAKLWWPRRRSHWGPRAAKSSLQTWALNISASSIFSFS